MRMFITVLHADNEKTLFNIQCRISVLLDSIKSHCHCENEAEIDLVDGNGEVKNLPEQKHEYAYKALREREDYALVSVRRLDDSSQPVYTMLLRDQVPLRSRFIAKLRSKEEPRAPKRKRPKRTSALFHPPQDIH